MVQTADTCLDQRHARSGIALLASTLLSFLAASSAPTPLYPVYQAHWAFSPAMLTLVFAIYAFSLLAALLTLGKLSDYLGRRPVILAALLLEMLAMALFIEADGVAWLLAARVMQGFATGMATSVLGAALLDRNPERGPLFNSVAPQLGMACGALGCGMLVEWAPWPLHLVYLILLLVFAAQALLLWWLPESISRRPGALASLRPTLKVPPQARGALWRTLPVNVAVWSLGGFYLSLAPSLIRAATDSNSALVGGLAVTALTLSGALSILWLRQHTAQQVLRIATALLLLGVSAMLVAVQAGWLWLFLVASLVAGGGFGSGFLGALRSVMPLAHAHERAGLMATYYVISYLAFCVPALLAGVSARHFGLVATATGFALVLIGLILVALQGVLRPERA